MHGGTMALNPRDPQQHAIYEIQHTRFEILIKASEYCKSDVKSKYCKLCVDEFRLELLRDIDMLLIFENYIQREIAELERSKNLDQILRTK